MSRVPEAPRFDLAALAFGAHPDDVELGCGGLLALCAARGHRAGVVDLTRGELATQGDPETRAAEAEAAARILGLAHRENLGLPDGFLAPEAGYEPAAARPDSALARVVEALRRLRPELVLAPYAEQRHPDHAATSALVTRAVFFAGVARFETRPQRPAFRPRQLLYYAERVPFEPDFVADVSAVHARKLEAIRAYASQVRRAPAAAEATGAPGDAEATLISSPLTLEVVDARDRMHGALIGVRHGEGFLMQGTPGLHDPVAFFRDNAFERPLALRGRR